MRGNVVTIDKFDGTYTDQDGQIPENGFRELFNVEISNNGTIKSRSGWTHEGSTTKTNAAIVGRWRTVSGSDYIASKTSTGCSFIDTLTSTVVFNLATPLDLMLQYDNKAYLFSTSANLQTYDGALVATGVTYKGTVGLVHKTRMFICDNTAASVSRSQVRYSDLFAANAPNTVGGWPANNFGDFQSSDGDFITAMAILNDVIIVFKRFSTWAYYVDGEPPWTIRNIHPSIGCIARDSAVVIGGLLYFVSAQGVYRTDGTTMELLSGNVEDDWDQVSSADATTTNMSSAVEYDGKYIINIANNNSLAVYNIENGAWSMWTMPTDLSRLFSLPDTTPWEMRAWYFGTNQQCAKYSSLTLLVDKASTPYSATISTKFTNFDKPELYKRIKEVSFDFSTEQFAGSLSGAVTYTKDNASVVSTGTKTIIPSYRRRLLRFPGPGMCRFLQTSLVIPVTQKFELNSISYDIATRERVGRAR
jgi:hypothetical protein